MDIIPELATFFAEWNTVFPEETVPDAATAITQWTPKLCDVYNKLASAHACTPGTPLVSTFTFTGKSIIRETAFEDTPRDDQEEPPPVHSVVDEKYTPEEPPLLSPPTAFRDGQISIPEEPLLAQGVAVVEQEPSPSPRVGTPETGRTLNPPTWGTFRSNDSSEQQPGFTYLGLQGSRLDDANENALTESRQDDWKTIPTRGLMDRRTFLSLQIPPGNTRDAPARVWATAAPPRKPVKTVLKRELRMSTCDLPAIWGSLFAPSQPP